MKVVLDESGFGMKVVLDENFWDEKRQVHPNLDETVPNPVTVQRRGYLAFLPLPLGVGSLALQVISPAPGVLRIISTLSWSTLRLRYGCALQERPSSGGPSGAHRVLLSVVREQVNGISAHPKLNS